MNCGRIGVLAAVVLVAAAAACGGSATDKAGGSRSGKTLVLTLEQRDPQYSGGRFAAAVAKRSGGSIRINLVPELQPSRVDFEQAMVENVRAGRVDLGVVPVRVWDTLGVDSFKPLIAPFLVDSLELERAVIESPLGARMLAGVERAGVAGIALLPGPLRRPFGYTRPLVSRGDWQGFRLGVRPGWVEAATARSLGATTRVYLTLSGASREGAVLDLGSIAQGGGMTYGGGKTVAANVVLWPRAETVVMNREAFEALSPEQQEILRLAGRDAVSGRADDLGAFERDALASICKPSDPSLVTVPAADVASMRVGVRPVYAELERNPQARALLAQIRKLRARQGGAASTTVRCPAAETTGAPELEGRWTLSATSQALREHGATEAEAATYEGSGTFRLNDGRWSFENGHTTVTGTYAVNGDLLHLTMRTCTANPCTPGGQTELMWSVYRDTLSLRARPGGSSWAALVAVPLRRP
jgi:TRAP-type C4-dicarboxylate transport system substrate-binding protein